MSTNVLNRMAPIACVHNHSLAHIFLQIMARSVLRDAEPALALSASANQSDSSTSSALLAKSKWAFSTLLAKQMYVFGRGMGTLDGSLVSKCITWDKVSLRFSTPSAKTIVLRYCDDSMERLERETLADSTSWLHIHLTLKCAVDLKVDLRDVDTMEGRKISMLYDKEAFNELEQKVFGLLPDALRPKVQLVD